MDMDSQEYVLEEKISSQVTDSYYERNLRVLQQIQEKRASLLGSRGQAGLAQTQSFEKEKNETLTENSWDRNSKSSVYSLPPLLYFTAVERAKPKVSVELNSKSPDYSLPPPRYFTPVEKAQSNESDFTKHLMKPTPRHVGVVRPVQYPDRKICHPVPQAMRLPHGSTPADITGSRHLPPKKRPYIPTQEDVGPSSEKVGRMGAIIDYTERSAFYKYIPARVMDDYFRFLRHTETGMKIEDRKVAENTNNNAVQNNLSSFMKERTTDLAEDNDELDMEVAEIFNTKPELKMENCQSPKEPWIPQITDDSTTAVDKENLDMNKSFIQQITPIIISLSPSNSHNSLTIPETASDVNSNFIQDISPVITNPSPRHSRIHQSSFEAFSETIRSNNSCTERTEVNLAFPEPSADLTKPFSAVSSSEAGCPVKKKLSMEELRRMVLDRSVDRPGLDRFTQTEEEQFAEILEDFLEENEGLPPEIRDVILDMLIKTKETVAEQKESILYTAEIYKGESEDEAHMDDFGRADNDEVTELINEMELPNRHTPDLTTAVTSESPKAALLDMETNMDEFDRAADDEVMNLINEIELPDLTDFVTIESPNDVLLDMGTTFRESMAEPADGNVYSTDVFIGADDERLLAEFERAVNSGLVSEDTRTDKLPDPTVHHIEESSKSKFKSIKCVEVEMDSTGQEIYDEIASFFGYDGYNDYFSYEYSAKEPLPELPFEYSADEEHDDLAIDDPSHEYSESEDFPDRKTDYKIENGVLLFE